MYHQVFLPVRGDSVSSGSWGHEPGVGISGVRKVLNLCIDKGPLVPYFSPPAHSSGSFKIISLHLIFIFNLYTISECKIQVVLLY
jgi:hypothetical protein